MVVTNPFVADMDELKTKTGNYLNGNFDIMTAAEIDGRHLAGGKVPCASLEPEDEKPFIKSGHQLIARDEVNHDITKVSCKPLDKPFTLVQPTTTQSLLSVLGTHNKDEMSHMILAMSSSPEGSLTLRHSGCIPLLIHLIHGNNVLTESSDTSLKHVTIRSRACSALHNIVFAHPDDVRGRQEVRVLRLLEDIRSYCDHVRTYSFPDDHSQLTDEFSDISEYHPGPAVAALMKLTFDEEHRLAICTLGGVQAISELLQLERPIEGNMSTQYYVTMRRYMCMALTNLTFGDGANKSLLCSMPGALQALVSQLKLPNEDLSQVAASVLRNLSWHADVASKRALRDARSVTALMESAMEAQKESTLKSILSALWNLSSHCMENKAELCAIPGALEFLVGTLTYKSPSKTLSVMENGGGILRNISSHIAVREDYRAVLRQYGCLQILLKHLRSPSLTVVSNACGTLWNLSARCSTDQQLLWQLGAVSMLKNLVHSRHRMIATGSAAALRNLLAAAPETDSVPKMLFSRTESPGLHVRRQKALQSELDKHDLTSTCDNVESPQRSPKESPKLDIYSRLHRLIRSNPCNRPPTLLSGRCRSLNRSSSCGNTYNLVMNQSVDSGLNYEFDPRLTDRIGSDVDTSRNLWAAKSRFVSRSKDNSLSCSQSPSSFKSLPFEVGSEERIMVSEDLLSSTNYATGMFKSEQSLKETRDTSRTRNKSSNQRHLNDLSVNSSKSQDRLLTLNFKAPERLSGLDAANVLSMKDLHTSSSSNLSDTPNTSAFTSGYLSLADVTNQSTQICHKLSNQSLQCGLQLTDKSVSPPVLKTRSPHHSGTKAKSSFRFTLSPCNTNKAVAVNETKCNISSCSSITAALESDSNSETMHSFHSGDITFESSDETSNEPKWRQEEISGYTKKKEKSTDATLR